MLDVPSNVIFFRCRVHTRCGCGEIGIRGGLKIHWGFPRCRFESDQPHQIVPAFRVHRRAILLRASTTNFVYADRGERNRINKANLLVVNLSEKHDMGF